MNLQRRLQLVSFFQELRSSCRLTRHCLPMTLLKVNVSFSFTALAVMAQRGKVAKDPIWRCHAWRAAREEELIKVITDGIDGTEMPTSRLDKDQIKQVATFVRQLGVLPPKQFLAMRSKASNSIFRREIARSAMRSEDEGVLPARTLLRLACVAALPTCEWR